MPNMENEEYEIHISLQYAPFTKIYALDIYIHLMTEIINHL